jgi:hypothetical protein
MLEHASVSNLGCGDDPSVLAGAYQDMREAEMKTMLRLQTERNRWKDRSARWEFLARAMSKEADRRHRAARLRPLDKSFPRVLD